MFYFLFRLKKSVFSHVSYCLYVLLLLPTSKSSCMRPLQNILSSNSPKATAISSLHQMSKKEKSSQHRKKINIRRAHWQQQQFDSLLWTLVHKVFLPPRAKFLLKGGLVYIRPSVYFNDASALFLLLMVPPSDTDGFFILSYAFLYLLLHYSGYLLVFSLSRVLFSIFWMLSMFSIFSGWWLLLLLLVFTFKEAWRVLGLFPFRLCR